jgi:hypothetical protein
VDASFFVRVRRRVDARVGWGIVGWDKGVVGGDGFAELEWEWEILCKEVACCARETATVFKT